MEIQQFNTKKLKLQLHLSTFSNFCDAPAPFSFAPRVKFGAALEDKRAATALRFRTHGEKNLITLPTGASDAASSALGHPG